MSQTPPPPVAAPRRRFSGRWFWVPGSLLLVAVALFVLMFFPLFRGLFTVDARVPVDGRWHQVSLPAQQHSSVYAPAGSSTTCQARTAAGQPLVLRNSTFEASRQLGEIEYRMIYTFDTGDGRAQFSCSGEAERVELGPVPITLASLGWFAAALIGSVVAGLLGVGLLILFIILYATSRR